MSVLAWRVLSLLRYHDSLANQDLEQIAAKEHLALAPNTRAFVRRVVGKEQDRAAPRRNAVQHITVGDIIKEVGRALAWRVLKIEEEGSRRPRTSD